jgi:hypothetical protein
VFTNPLLRQQIVIPKAIEKTKWIDDLDIHEKRFLGFNSISPNTDKELKETRLKRELNYE